MNGFKKSKERKQEVIRSYIILCIYMVFIIGLVIFVRVSENHQKDLKEKEQTKEEATTSEKNYAFTFKLSIDNKRYTYEGIRYGSKYKFSVISKDGILNYYLYGDIALMQKDKEWVLTKIPYYYINYFDTDTINKLIDMGNYNNEEKQYEIYTSNFAYVMGEEINSKDLNTIKIINNDGKSKSVIIDYTNYCINMGEPVRLVKIEIEYKDYNKIKDFEIK